MMKKIGFLLLLALFSISVYTGCKKQSTNEKELPEKAPICPDGFYWIDSAKTCVVIEDSFLE